MNTYSQNKKWRYGTLSVAFTALFIAVVVLLNVIFSALSGRYLWYIDMTSETLYTLSDACVDLLKDIDDEVTILFCADPDTLEETDTTRLVYNTARQLEEKLDFITVKTVNIVTNPSAVEKYKTTPTTRILTNDVIIESGTEFRKLALTAFYTFSNSTETKPWAYNAEAKFASTILAVTRTESPVCCLVSNHGEAYADSELMSLVYDAGYDCQVIDLSRDEIPADCRLMICYNPVNDFMTTYDGVSEVSEIEKLDQYLDGVNSFMLFVSPATPVLPNLEEYLYEWGVKLGRHTEETSGSLYSCVVKDTSQSLTFDGYTIVADYVTEENSLGLQINTDLTNAGTAPKIIFSNAMPILHADHYDSTGYYSSNGYHRQISDIFVSSEKAVMEANGVEVGRATSLSPYPLMTITAEGRQVGGSSVAEYSYLMVCGSTEFAEANLLQSNVYGNSESLYSALRIMQREIISVETLAKKPFAKTNIESLTTAQAKTDTILLTVIPATLVFLCGIVLVVKRRFA